MEHMPLKPLASEKLKELKEFIGLKLRQCLPGILPDYCKKEGTIFESWIEEISSSISDALGDADVVSGGYDQRSENYKRMQEVRVKIANLFCPEDGLRLRRHLGSPEFMCPILEYFHQIK